MVYCVNWSDFAENVRLALITAQIPNFVPQEACETKFSIFLQASNFNDFELSVLSVKKFKNKKSKSLYKI